MWLIGKPPIVGCPQQRCWRSFCANGFAWCVHAPLRLDVGIWFYDPNNRYATEPTRFVATISFMSAVELKPSDWFSSSCTVRCTLRLPAFSESNRFVPIASSSSMKMMTGAFSLASAKASRTSFAPSPMNICTSCGPANFKNVDFQNQIRIFVHAHEIAGLQFFRINQINHRQKVRLSCRRFDHRKLIRWLSSTKTAPLCLAWSAALLHNSRTCPSTRNAYSAHTNGWQSTAHLETKETISFVWYTVTIQMNYCVHCHSPNIYLIVCWSEYSATSTVVYDEMHQKPLLRLRIEKEANFRAWCAASQNTMLDCTGRCAPIPRRILHAAVAASVSAHEMPPSDFWRVSVLMSVRM